MKHGAAHQIVVEVKPQEGACAFLHKHDQLWQIVDLLAIHLQDLQPTHHLVA